MNRPIVAIDFDGTIHDMSTTEWPHLGTLFEGAEEFLRAIHTKYDIVIWSARCNSNVGVQAIRNLLIYYKLMGIIKDVTCNIKNYNVIMIVDDRARRCDGNKHYREIMEELRV